MDVALLNSRKPRRIRPNAWWLRATFTLAAHYAQAGHRVCTSAGNLPYEAALYGAARWNGLVLAVTSRRFLPRLKDCLPPDYPMEDRLEVRLVTQGNGLERDRTVIEAADVAIAVAVSAGGHMASLLIDRRRRGRPVLVIDPADAMTPAQTSPSPRRSGSRDETSGNRMLLAAGVPALSGSARKALLDALPHATVPALAEPWPPLPPLWASAPLPGDVLAHYTRACPGPWPGQPRWTFLEDLHHGGSRARRDPRATLMHILEERRIRASSRLTRGQYPVVSLTARRPETLSALTRYRPHLVRWDFQPFGLVFDRGWLQSLGARPVRYLPDEAFARLPESERPWFQKHDPPRCDYREEQEWRILGDLDFAAVPREAIRIVLPDD